MTSAGPNIAGTGADNSASGSVAWTTPGNVTANDASNATITLQPFNNNPLFSHYLKATNFGFSIPAGATVLGIQVGVNKAMNVGGTSAQDGQVKLVNGSGSVVGTDHGDTVTAWGTSFSTVNYGGSADTWSASLTDTDINSSSFGVVIQAQQKTNFATSQLKVNYIQVTITYSSGTNNSIIGTITAASAIAGQLDCNMGLVASVSGASAVAGTLNAAWDLVGSIAAASAVSGLAGVNYVVSGAISAASAIAGTLGLTQVLTGSITAASAIAGTILRTFGLGASVSGASSITGDLPVKFTLTGTVPGASAVAGTPTLNQGMAGSISGASAISGIPLLNQGLGGLVTAASAIAGTLTRLFDISGLITAAVAITPGDLDLNYAGACDVGNTSQVGGSLGMNCGLVGDVGSASSVAGTLSVAKNGNTQAPGMIGDRNKCPLPPLSSG